MAAEVNQIDAFSFLSQTYNVQDINLIPSFDVNTTFTSESYIEFFVYDNNQNIISENYDFTEYTILNDGQSAGSNNTYSQIQLDPENILINNGYVQGEYTTYFNILNNKIGNFSSNLFISEISPDRTEIRLDSTVLSELDIIESTNVFVQERDLSIYFVDFYLNFGENNLVIANNVVLDQQDPSNPTVLIKLYEPLPEQYDINSTLWVVAAVDEPLAYKVIFPEEPIVIQDTTPVKGPNFNIDLKDQINNSTVALDYTSLTTTTLTSSFNQLSSLLEEREIDINVDYTDFSNFIHFSSVQSRLENFYYKIQLIEQYSNNISILNNTTSSASTLSSSQAVYESYINNIITNFDGYEYYLYYETGSYAWPKTNNQKPYILANSTSSQVLTWIGTTNYNSQYYGGLILSASEYDNNNKDNLLYVIPEYLRDDPQNDPYQLFIEMVGQHYDNIWIYYKDISNKYNGDNRLEYGISKDIVADAIRDFGVKLYQNNFSNEDLYTAFLGLTPGGGLFPFPNITGSLPTPSGFEYVDTLISASNDYLPLDDVNKSLYKRIYHNLPYLLKSKGTLPGLRTLITSYGIPDTVLRIKEYGGKDKANINDWDYWQDTFNYAFYTTGSNSISSNWKLNPNWNAPDSVPATLAFRFKTEGLPTSSIPYSQSLWYTDTYSSIVLQYTGSGYATGSYSGSIIDPYYQYAHLTFYPDPTTYPASTASIYLPFFNGGWWSVMVTRNGDDFNLYAGNNIYEGGDNGTLLGFYSSSSINEDSTFWTLGSNVTFASQNPAIPGGLYESFSGSLQEIRYYNSVINENVFKDYIMNPYSIEGNTLNSSPNELAFRASLGGELYTGSISIHPKVTGSWTTTSSFNFDSDFVYSNIPTFIHNTEYFFIDQPLAGIKNAVSDKIRVENNVIPSGDTLSAFRTLSQNAEISQSYTANTNLLEVAFSPQDEINDDIADQIGYYNIGNFIGDPRFRSSSALTYPELDTLRNAYFEKYTRNYDLNDYIRLIKFFDNSLFKMIKDFVPARTSLASGIVIKQHILERNRYPQPQVSWENDTYSGSIKSTQVWNYISQSNEISHSLIETFDGGAGGTFNQFNGLAFAPSGSNIYGITQSWNEYIESPLGLVVRLHESQDEFYNGEFDGSTLIVTTQSLFEPYPLLFETFDYKHVHYNYTTTEIGNELFNAYYLDPITSPQPGEILFLNVKENPPTVNPIAGAKYLKVAKFDCSGSDASLPLGQADTIYIQNVFSTTSGYTKYKIAILNEFPDYYFYEVLNSTTIPTVGFAPNQRFDYTVSSSISSSQTIFGQSTFAINKIDPWDSILTGTNLAHYGTPYFNTSSGYFTLENTPNTLLSVTASIVTSGSTAGRFQLYVDRQGSYIQLDNQTYSLGANVTSTVTSSYYGIQGDQLFLIAYKNGAQSSILKSGSLLITQSQSTLSSSCYPSFIEPYITEPNYYNSDYNPLLNNAEIARLSAIYQDVDYSTGLLTPTNFDFLISESAIKAAIQDSNYSSKRVTVPRYDGSKSTSQYLNVWTPGDEGTYGKTPTVENLKTMIAYCDSISGWPSERMNASAIHILYLIKSDGTVVIPNTSENSLYDNKGTFESGEKLIISPKTVAAGDPQQYRNVIRGGTRIEPILYTQSGSAPNAKWNTTMSFQDITLTTSGSVGNYTGLFQTTGSAVQIFGNTPTKVSFSSAIYGNTYLSNNGYQITTGPIGDGVNLYLDAEIKYAILQPPSTTINYTIELSIYKNGSPLLDITGNPISIVDTPSFNTVGNQGTIDITGVLLSNPSLVTNDVYTAYIEWIGDIAGGSFFVSSNSTFKIYQSPIATSPVTASGVNSLWGFPNKTTYPYIITSSQSTLVNLYGDPNVKMRDITGSGFNPVTLPWSIEYGDEFRFEGREDFVYQVGKIFGPDESGSGRVTQTGSIEVHFNTNLPVSASSSVFNLDHFSIRRYIDDASLILMEGYRPINSSGPYIVRPEYVVPELDKSIDEFILDLTQKGLIT
jgi:hypothetical protein